MARVVFESDVQGTREWQQEITQKVQVPFEESIRELLAEARVGCRSVRNYDLAEGSKSGNWKVRHGVRRSCAAAKSARQ